jgi:hypothetical protein
MKVYGSLMSLTSYSAGASSISWLLQADPQSANKITTNQRIHHKLSPPKTDKKMTCLDKPCGEDEYLN